MRQPTYLAARRATMFIPWSAIIMPVAALLFFGVSLWRLSAPPLWWDEGWTLTVARTWVEHGHYGRLQNGQLVPGGLEAAFPTTASVALSFKLFGVGVWQGRLPGVLYILGALAMLYTLVQRLYNQRIALATLGVLLLMSMHPDLHPLTMGRQVLAEMPMLFFLLSGYLALLVALNHSQWYVVISILCWGTALITKAQALPFWAASLLLPSFVALVGRRWSLAGLLGLGFVGGLTLWSVLPTVIVTLLNGHSLQVQTLTGLYEVTAFVTAARNRILALQILLIAGLPTVLGLCYVAWQFVTKECIKLAKPEMIVRLSMLVLAGSWCAWYGLLSLGVPRYLFPALFLSGMFTAVLLHDLTMQFNFAATLERMASILRFRQWSAGTAGAWLAVLLVCLTAPLTLQMLQTNYILNSDMSAQQVVAYLHSHTRNDALIETYHSELFLFLNRPYHYPPDQFHVALLRKAVYGDAPAVTYDPLDADPDYLVVQTQKQDWRPYDAVLATGAFRLLQRVGPYDVYQRLR